MLMSGRTIRRLHPATRDDIGDLTTRRPLPGPRIEHLDPFLFLNHHGPQVYPPGNRGLPFGPHPHRGFETVTFILDGELEHRDTAGHRSVIRAGGVQWMTAGRGLIHSELSPEEFRRDGGPLEILQLWVNLPARMKFSPPAYIGLQRQSIPAVPTADGRGRVNLIAGRTDGVDGPIRSLIGAFMSTVELDPGGSVLFDGLAGRSVFLYVVRGSIAIGEDSAPRHVLVHLSDDGDSVAIRAVEDTLLLFGHAAPIGEPIVSYGPFVMNTREQIAQAIRDYQAGLFDVAPARES
jgi:redox-sensitive bicupin YhaK (pirin superfamily)